MEKGNVAAVMETMVDADLSLKEREKLNVEFSLVTCPSVKSVEWNGEEAHIVFIQSPNLRRGDIIVKGEHVGVVRGMLERAACQYLEKLAKVECWH